MYHRPGTLMRVLSWKSAPRYQAGSFGVRRIMASKTFLGAPTELRMSCTGRTQNALVQSTGGNLAARSHDFESRMRSSCDMFGGNIGRCGFSLSQNQLMLYIMKAPPRYQLPCS